jgi:steroid delta-isomerase-like uncharacterized protein
MPDLAHFARDHFAAVDSGDTAAIATRLDPDCDFSAPGFAARGADAVLGFMQPFLDAFPDIHHEVVRTVQADDTVAIEVRITGTQTQPLAGPDGALPATGRPIDFQAANVWQVVDGRIASYRVYFDTATLMGQLAAGDDA